MKRNDSAKDLHLELLGDDKVHLESDGRVFTEGILVHNDKDVFIDYRDEGPDAWACSAYFSGPVWVWTSHGGWNFYNDGVSITGYCGLSASVLTIKEDGLHLTKCYGEEM